MDSYWLDVQSKGVDWLILIMVDIYFIYGHILMCVCAFLLYLYAASHMESQPTAHNGSTDYNHIIIQSYSHITIQSYNHTITSLQSYGAFCCVFLVY